MSSNPYSCVCIVVDLDSDPAAKISSMMAAFRVLPTSRLRITIGPMKHRLLALGALFSLGVVCWAAPAISSSIKTIRAVRNEGQGNAAAANEGDVEHDKFLPLRA
mgnify:CR=1 FL=1